MNKTIKEAIIYLVSKIDNKELLMCIYEFIRELVS